MRFFVAGAVLLGAAATPAGAQLLDGRADTLATYRWTLAGPWTLGAAGDTAEVAVEREWRAPCPGGVWWVNAYRYTFVRDAAGWRFVQRRPTAFSDGTTRCLTTGRPPTSF